MLPLSIGQLCRRSTQGVWAQAFLGEMGHLVYVGSLKWSTRIWFMSSHQSLLPRGQNEIELFDWSLSISLPVSLVISPDSSCVILPPLRLGQISVPPHPHSGEVSPTFCPHPHQEEEIVPSIYGHQFFPGGFNLLTSCAGLFGSLEGMWCVTLAWWGLHTHSGKIGSAPAGYRESGAQGSVSP
jgi:hypothetical protein